MKYIDNKEVINQINYYNKATKTLSDWRNIYTDGDYLQRDGIIQRFEYCVELWWKTMKIYLQYIWVENIIASPKEVIKLAHKYKIIENDDIWFDFINCRNRLSHIYSEPDSDDIFDFICNNCSN